MGVLLDRLGLDTQQAEALQAGLAGAIQALEEAQRWHVFRAGGLWPLVESEQDPYTQEDKDRALMVALRMLSKYRPDIFSQLPKEEEEPQEEEPQEEAGGVLTMAGLKLGARTLYHEVGRPAPWFLLEQGTPGANDPRWSHLPAIQALTARERQELWGDLSKRVQRDMEAARDQLLSGEIAPNQFRTQMERAIWQEARASYLAGKIGQGGPAVITREEEKELRRWGNFQVNRLNKFVAQIKKQIKDQGELSPGWVQYRVGLYSQAIRGVYTRGESRAFGDLQLSNTPGDGKTECRNNCKCYLKYEVVRGPDGQVIAVNVYWVLRPVKTKHCGDCLKLHASWNPKRVNLVA